MQITVNPTGRTIRINAPQGGLVHGYENILVSALVISSPLTGTLTITGITDGAGGAVAWSLAPGSSGLNAAPGAKHTGGGQLWCSLSDPADAGKALFALEFR
jgi:hypothetical protein